MLYLTRSVPMQCIYLDPQLSRENPMFEYVYTDRYGGYDEPVLKFPPTETVDVHISSSFLGRDIAHHSSILHDMIAEDINFVIRPNATYHLICVREDHESVASQCGVME
tara:strand:+ start:2448 stop:2774 length:327 start_codon:yes stop_codon:yes gene_type:complete